MNRNQVLLIWKKRNQIIEGIKHSVFKHEDIEQVASERLEICRKNICTFHDPKGISGAAVFKGKESCGHCGCKLSWKTRALSDECPLKYWGAVLSPKEEKMLKQKLGIQDGE